MKMRMGFVTNSSSSSFILVRKDNVDVDRLAKYILANNDDVFEEIIERIEFHDIYVPDEIQDAYDNNNPNLKEIIAMTIAKELASYGAYLDFNDWHVSGGPVYEQDDEFMGYFIYSCGRIDLDDFKFTIT